VHEAKYLVGQDPHLKLARAEQLQQALQAVAATSDQRCGVVLEEA
jgi:hypothetical protein